MYASTIRTTFSPNWSSMRVLCSADSARSFTYQGMRFALPESLSTKSLKRLMLRKSWPQCIDILCSPLREGCGSSTLLVTEHAAEYVSLDESTSTASTPSASVVVRDIFSRCAHTNEDIPQYTSSQASHQSSSKQGHFVLDAIYLHSLILVIKSSSPFMTRYRTISNPDNNVQP